MTCDAPRSVHVVYLLSGGPRDHALVDELPTGYGITHPSRMQPLFMGFDAIVAVWLGDDAAVSEGP